MATMHKLRFSTLCSEYPGNRQSQETQSVAKNNRMRKCVDEGKNAKNSGYLRHYMCFNESQNYMEKRLRILPSVKCTNPALAPSVGCSAKPISAQFSSDINSYSKSKNILNCNCQPANMYLLSICVPSLNWVPCPPSKCSYRAKLVFHRSTYKLLRM